LYLTAVPSERSTAVTCGQYSSRYVSATGCEEEETTTRRPKEKKKEKRNTNYQKLPHRIATARQPEYERRNKVFPASYACFSSRSSSVCPPACLPAYLPFRFAMRFP